MLTAVGECAAPIAGASRARERPLTPQPIPAPRPPAGLTKFNLFDVGLTGAIKALYVRQPAPADAHTTVVAKHH